MKKIILTIGIVSSMVSVQAQTVTKDLDNIQKNATQEVSAKEGSVLGGALTQLVGGINPASFVKGTSAKDLLAKLQLAKGISSYSSLLGNLTNSLSPASFVPAWAGLKTVFNDKLTKAKSAVEVAGLASQLLGNLKPAALNTGFDKAGLLKTLSGIK